MQFHPWLCPRLQQQIQCAKGDLPYIASGKRDQEPEALDPNMALTLATLPSLPTMDPHTSSYPLVELSLLSAALGLSGPKFSTTTPYIHVVPLQSPPLNINSVYTPHNTVTDAPPSTGMSSANPSVVRHSYGRIETISSKLTDSNHTKTPERLKNVHATSSGKTAKQCGAFVKLERGETRRCRNKTKTMRSTSPLKDLDVSAYRCHLHVDQDAVTTAKLKEDFTAISTVANAHPCGALVKVKGEKDRIRPCINRTSKPLPFDVFLDPDTGSEPVDYRCHVHLAPKDTRIQSRKNENFIIDLSRYISNHLSTPTQCAIRQKMAAAPTEADGPGYIYVFLIIGGIQSYPLNVSPATHTLGISGYCCSR